VKRMRVFAYMAAATFFVTCSSAAARMADVAVPGGRIVFVRFFDSTHRWGGLFTMSTQGGAVRQVTFPPEGVLDTEPVWSPNGKRIAFQRTQGNHTLVFIVNATGGRPREVAACTTACIGEDSPAWSPSGSTLAIGIMARAGGESVWNVKPSGRKLRRLTRPDPANTDTEPGWSPDGRQLTFTRKTAQPAPDGRRALFVIGVNGKGERRLSPWPLRSGHHPEWSPNGKRILFCSNADQAVPNSPSNIYSIHPDGTGLVQITHARADQQYFSASFSPDGRWIVFGLRPGKDANEQVFAMRTNGADVHALTPAKFWDGAPDWTAPARRTRRR
jgi:TolB protein